MAEKTTIRQLKIRSRGLYEWQEREEKPYEILMKQPEPAPHGDHLLRNMAVAASLLLCAIMLRSGAIPELSAATDVVLTAATDDSILDDRLGRLSFVSAIFPEATLVFGESTGERLSLPVSGGMVVHAWSQSEPYMSWRTSCQTVRAAADGEVIGVYHANGDERLVQVMGESGLSCVYGNLADLSVCTGDAVKCGDPIGTLLMGEDLVMEVRRDGMSIDPALYLNGI